MNEREQQEAGQNLARGNVRARVETALERAVEAGATNEAEYSLAVVTTLLIGWDTMTTAAMVKAVVDVQPIEVIEALAADALTKLMGRLA